MATRMNFEEWLPDQPGLVGAVKEALNVVPQAVGYGPLRTPVDYSQAASENINNVVAGRNPSSGNTEVFAGGATKLFKLDSNDLSLDNVSKAGGYTTLVEQKWRFTQFGNVLIAGNGSTILQAWTLGSSTAWADLDAAAPQARYLTVVRDFVVAGYTSGTTHRRSNGLVSTTRPRGLRLLPTSLTTKLSLTEALFRGLRVVSLG